MIFGPRITPRYVLRSQRGPEIVEDFARQYGWPRVSEAQEDQARGIRREIRWLTQTTLMLQYEVDYISGQSYVYFSGDDFETLPSLVESLASSLQFWTRDDLLRAVDDATSDPNKGKAVLRAALGAPMEFDAEFFNRINGCMTAGEPALRNVGLLAAGAASWAQFRPVVERIATEDPEAEVREMARSVLSAYDEFEIN